MKHFLVFIILSCQKVKIYVALICRDKHFIYKMLSIKRIQFVKKAKFVEQIMKCRERERKKIFKYQKREEFVDNV